MPESVWDEPQPQGDHGDIDIPEGVPMSHLGWDSSGEERLMKDSMTGIIHSSLVFTYVHRVVYLCPTRIQSSFNIREEVGDLMVKKKITPIDPAAACDAFDAGATELGRSCAHLRYHATVELDEMLKSWQR